jgi:threonine/homoserine/homoserine lactone efflux protein
MFWQVLTGFETSVLVTFVLAGLLLNITPGADFIFITASGISGGPKAGIAAAVGVNLGVVVHIAMAAAGVSALLLAYPAAYDAIRYVGAVYLLYIAWQAWTDRSALGKGRATHSARAALRRGFITNVLNPKTALFVFAFIPQFTDPAIGVVWMQILILGGIFLINGFLFVLVLGTTAGLFSEFLRARVRVLNKITAILFGGLAARLIID